MSFASSNSLRAAPLETLAPGPSDGLAGRAYTVFRRVPLDLEGFDIQVHLGSWFEHAGPVPLSLSAPLVGMQDWISRMGVLALPRREPPRLEDGARGELGYDRPLDCHDPLSEPRIDSPASMNPTFGRSRRICLGIRRISTHAYSSRNTQSQASR